MMNSQNDTTNYTASGINSAGQVVPGSPVTITAGLSVTWMVGSSNTLTMIFDRSDNNLIFLNNAGETINTRVPLAVPPIWACFRRTARLSMRRFATCPSPVAVTAACRW